MSYSEGGEHAGSASHFAGSSAAVGGEESRPTLFQTQARGPAPPSSPPPPPPLPSPPQPPRQLDTSSALAAVSAVVGEKGSVCFKDPTDLSPISFHGLSMGAYYTVAGEARPVFQEASFGKDDIGVYIEVCCKRCFVIKKQQYFFQATICISSQTFFFHKKFTRFG